MKVFLMGMPGSGKTTLGKKLANKLRLPFIDLDQYIATKESRTVAAIFASDGEEKFRTLETKYLKKIIEEQNDIFLSLGGGTPCFNQNLTLVKQHGLTVYLEVPAMMLAERLKGKSERPLFLNMSDEQLNQKVLSLLNTREEFYLQAHTKISGKNVKVNEAASQILSALKEGHSF